MSNSQFEKRSSGIRFNGRILFLTEDTSLIRRQLEATGDDAKRIEDELAARLANDELHLMSNISTDEITPGWVCFYYDETLGDYVYVGMRDAAVKKDDRVVIRREIGGGAAAQTPGRFPGKSPAAIGFGRQQGDSERAALGGRRRWKLNVGE